MGRQECRKSETIIMSPGENMHMHRKRGISGLSSRQNELIHIVSLNLWNKMKKKVKNKWYRGLSFPSSMMNPNSIIGYRLNRTASVDFLRLIIFLKKIVKHFLCPFWKEEHHELHKWVSILKVCNTYIWLGKGWNDWCLYFYMLTK